MTIAEINISGYRSETKEVITKKGRMTVESLIPEKVCERAVKTAEHELYRVFSEYRKNAADGCEGS